VLSSQSITVDYYLSDDTSFGDADDVKIGDTGFTVSLGLQAKKTITLSSMGRANMVRHWPTDVPGGDYYVFARVSINDSPPSDPNSENDRGRTSAKFTYSEPEPETTLILNSDETSRHIAQATAGDGTVFDYWVEHDEDGAILYLSDIRAVQSDGTEIYMQVDALGRPTFYRGPSGETVRVHFYLDGGEADITVTTPDGGSARGIVDLAAAMADDGRAKSRHASFSKYEFAWEHRAQSIRNWIADVYAAVDTAREYICYTDLPGLVAGYGACALALGVDIVSHGATGGAVGLTVCPLSTSAVGQQALGMVLCEGLRILQDAEENFILGLIPDSDPPASPPTTGDVIVGTGDVHITLTWDNATDVDLHVTDPSGEEIYYSHPASASGGELDVDDTNGYGPENIFWAEGTAPAGQYTVEVVYYSLNGRGPSSYEVTVRYRGSAGQQVIEEYSGTLSSSGDSDTITTFEIQ